MTELVSINTEARRPQQNTWVYLIPFLIKNKNRIIPINKAKYIMPDIDTF